MNNTADIRVGNQAYGGDAIGKLADGRVVFSPFSISDEKVRVRLLEEKTHHARAELMEVLEASTERVIPQCKHFTTCGGCHYQQMNYPAQLRVKSAIVKEQLERIGGLRNIPEIEIEASVEPWYYRNHIQFHVIREGKLGFQKARSNQTFAISECHLPEAAINWLWPQIEIEPMAGLARVNLRLGADEEMMVVLESTEPQPVDFSIENLPVSIVQIGPYGNIILAGNDNITMEVSGRRFQVSASSFFQVNTQQASGMVKHLLQNLPIKKDMTVLDIYSGVGLFSAFMAPLVKRLVGIEISPKACEDFSTNLDEFDHVELYEASAEDVLRSIDFKPNIMIMDPPRTGLGVKTIEGLLRQGATTLAYISCDPATLARDAKLLGAGGYSLKKVTLFDMFPQTYHIETISLWEKC